MSSLSSLVPHKVPPSCPLGVFFAPSPLACSFGINSDLNLISRFLQSYAVTVSIVKSAISIKLNWVITRSLLLCQNIICPVLHDTHTSQLFITIQLDQFHKFLLRNRFNFSSCALEASVCPETDKKELILIPRTFLLTTIHRSTNTWDNHWVINMIPFGRITANWESLKCWGLFAGNK